MTLSFEAFPPKKDSDFDSVATAGEKIAQLKPDFMSVTYGAGGGTSTYTSQIGGACYPEGHVECLSQAEDLRHLKEKVDCGVDFLTTQMFFDNSALYSFLYRAQEVGINVPILAGIMPVTNAAQMTRILSLSGTTLPNRFRMILDRFRERPDAMKQAGIVYAAEQMVDLVANGVRGVHVYTMNKPDVAAGIAENLSKVLGRG